MNLSDLSFSKWWLLVIRKMVSMVTFMKNLGLLVRMSIWFEGRGGSRRMLNSIAVPCREKRIARCRTWFINYSLVLFLFS